MRAPAEDELVRRAAIKDIMQLLGNRSLDCQSDILTALVLVQATAAFPRHKTRTPTEWRRLARSYVATARKLERLRNELRLACR
jgi:hypothetical protein